MMLQSDQAALDEWLATARVLVVDDEPANLKFLRHVLEPEGYGQLMTMTDPVEALDRIDEIRPDVVIVDLRMPVVDGFEFIAQLRRLVPPHVYLPVLVTTGDHTPESRRRALSVGARDFLTKPLSPAEVRLRVRNLLETRSLHVQLRQHNALLEDRVRERTFELEEARLEILHRLARAAEYRDDQTGEHTLRVGRLAGRMARVLGVGDEEAELIVKAAPLHDIGKIGVPDAVLLKPGRLDDTERAVIESHTRIGAEILSGSRYSLLQLAEEIALTHHEHWNGGGYPHGLAGEDIPISGRIVAAADVFDALTHERPYKSAWTAHDALAEIEINAGRQFDPAVVKALKQVLHETGALEEDASGAGDQATSSRQPSSHEPTVAASPAPAPARVRVRVNGADDTLRALGINAAEMQQLKAERDVLAQEVERLRRQLAVHEAAAADAAWARPN